MFTGTKKTPAHAGKSMALQRVKTTNLEMMDLDWELYFGRRSNKLWRVDQHRNVEQGKCQKAEVGGLGCEG